MTAERDFDQRLKALENRLTEKIHAETGREKFGMLNLVAARWLIVRAMLEEMEPEQIKRISARAIESSGNPNVKKEVTELLSHFEEG
ncbi:hypothetical protein [Chachezhania sediminis]|uniref:hypothetical protein n=1 Tax=Chachezhania sediminis TaxID=2599291 RepID=UPI00131C0B1D|nr:hypothetical protein [Chachezhania sediminis]